MRAVLATSAVLLVAGCTGTIGEGPVSSTDLGGARAPASGPADPRATAGPSVAGAPTPPGATPAGPSAPDRPATPADAVCDPRDQRVAPARLWRLSGQQYRAAVSVLFDGRSDYKRRIPRDDIAVPFDAENEADRFSTHAASYTMNDFELRRVMGSAVDIAARVVARLRTDGCLSAKAPRPFADCMRSAIADRGAVLFSRPLTPDEVDRYSAVALGNVAALGEDDAAALAFQGLLQAPQFLFRSEIGRPDPATGLARLDQFELAAALSYTLAEGPPDDVLWKVAVAGALDSPEAIRAQVERMLSNGFRRDGGHPPSPMMQFLREYFQYRRVDRVFNADVPGLSKGYLLEDGDRFMDWVLAQNRRQDFLKTLLTTDATFANPVTGKFYGINDLNAATDVRARQPPGTRGGFLTQPPFLIGYSENTDTKPVQRGRFVRETLLCQTVPPLPIGQVPALPDTPGLTQREKLVAHAKDAACWACHQLMDPIGLTFERYDSIGRVRDKDVGGKPVDATGALTGAGAADGPLRDAVDLSARLATSPIVQACFVRHSFEYWLGRPATAEAGDGCALADATTTYQKDGDYVATLQSLFTSRSFLYRATNGGTR